MLEFLRQIGGDLVELVALEGCGNNWTNLIWYVNWLHLDGHCIWFCGDPFCYWNLSRVWSWLDLTLNLVGYFYNSCIEFIKVINHTLWLAGWGWGRCKGVRVWSILADMMLLLKLNVLVLDMVSWQLRSHWRFKLSSSTWTELFDLTQKLIETLIIWIFGIWEVIRRLFPIVHMNLTQILTCSCLLVSVNFVPIYYLLESLHPSRIWLVNGDSLPLSHLSRFVSNVALDLTMIFFH